MELFTTARKTLVPLLMTISLVFNTGCPWGGEGAKVKAAKLAFENYRREVALITSDPQNAGRHHDQAFSFVLQAQDLAKNAISGREKGHGDLNMTDINAAVEEARRGRFNHFTRLAEDYLNRGDRSIVEDPANPGQPANSRAAREAYETAKSHAEHVENRNILRSILDRFNLRPLRASIVADQVEELARAQQQALLLETKLQNGTADPHGYDRDWSDTISNWNFTSRESQLRQIQARISTLSTEVRSSLGQLATGAERQNLESQMSTLTRSYEQAVAVARSSTPDAFWASWENSRSSFEAARDRLSGAARDISTTRVASPNRVEQPTGPVGPGHLPAGPGRGPGGAPGVGPGVGPGHVPAAAPGTAPGGAPGILDGDDVRVTGP